MERIKLLLSLAPWWALVIGFHWLPAPDLLGNAAWILPIVIFAPIYVLAVCFLWFATLIVIISPSACK